MIGWLRGLTWLQPVVRTLAVGGYLVAVSWVTHRLAGGLSRWNRDGDARPDANVRRTHPDRSRPERPDTSGPGHGSGRLDRATAG